MPHSFAARPLFWLDREGRGPYNKDKYNGTEIIPVYLKAYFDTDYFQGIIGNIASVGSTRAYIGITAQQELPLVIPPIEVQNQFAAFVEQTDKPKLAIQQSLDKLETLKKSLMQEYFG